MNSSHIETLQEMEKHCRKVAADTHYFPFSPISANQKAIALSAILAERVELLKLAAIGVELASYANESRPENQPEFLDGLFERTQEYATAWEPFSAAIKEQA